MMERLLYDNLTHSASRAPEREAFRCGRSSITYRELDQASSQVAAVLVEHGAAAGDLIGIVMETSIDSIVAVYGVLKAGAAFVPVDPALPIDRVARIVKECALRVCLTNVLSQEDLNHLAGTAPCLQKVVGKACAQVAGIQAIDWPSADPSIEYEPVRVASSDPAYIIFTSGSTGSPKGIVHTHQSGQCYAELTTEAYQLCGHDRIASLSPLHFDMATFGVFAGVLAGSSVILVPPASTRLPASLSSLIERESITVWYSVPFALVQILKRGAIQLRDASSLRWVVFAGEPFPPDHLQNLRSVWDQASFSNAYGPAETNVCTVHHYQPVGQATTDSQSTESSIPIGKPWGEAKIMIVDEHDHTLPQGMEGELLVASDTMMQRYLSGTPDDCRTFFFAPRTGERFYRTGDLVFENQYGELEFVGRKDRQVKVRGHRLELDEIEGQINRCPGVGECAVVCSHSDDSNQLHGVFTVSEHENVTPEQLRSWLSARVPSYAIPQSLQRVSALPRLSTGKIDRQLITRQLEPAFQVADKSKERADVG